MGIYFNIHGFFDRGWLRSYISRLVRESLLEVLNDDLEEVGEYLVDLDPGGSLCEDQDGSRE